MPNNKNAPVNMLNVKEQTWSKRVVGQELGKAYMLITTIQYYIYTYLIFQLKPQSHSEPELLLRLGFSGRFVLMLRAFTMMNI